MDNKDWFEDISKNIDEWRYRARLIAHTQPARFFVVLGCTLPEYEAQLDKLEAVVKEINGKTTT